MVFHRLLLVICFLFNGACTFHDEYRPPPENPRLPGFPVGISEQFEDIETLANYDQGNPILLMPLDKEIFEIKKDGVQTLLRIETSNARGSEIINIEQNLGELGVPSVSYDKNNKSITLSEAAAKQQEIIREENLTKVYYHPSHSPILDEVYQIGISNLSQKESNATYEKEKTLPGTIGNELKSLKEAFNTDFALFIYYYVGCCFDSSEPHNVTVYGSLRCYDDPGFILSNLLLSMYDGPGAKCKTSSYSYGIRRGFLTLVELETGNLVWFKGFVESTLPNDRFIPIEGGRYGDYRGESGKGAMVDWYLKWLFEDFPLGSKASE